MVRPEVNRAINERLRNAYRDAAEAILGEWQACFGKTPPCRINEFGIIDEMRYDTEDGMLVIGRETNDWSDAEYEAGCLFRGWMEEITHKGLAGRGKVRRHPNMWYNIGRWVTLWESPDTSLAELAEMKSEVLPAIGRIAFTNVNKVRGKAVSGNAYRRLAMSAAARSLLGKEIEILSPKAILCCGTAETVRECLTGYNGKLLCMPHPAARKSTLSMLELLYAQLG